MNFNRRGLLLALSSPSGAGKTSVAQGILHDQPKLSMSISVTTRAPRPGEKNGEDYYFKSTQEFQRLREEGAFLEHATVFKNNYGTLKTPVEEALSESNDVLFDIDWQGVQQIKQSMGNDLVSIFILPPSLKILEKRLRQRAQDSKDVIQLRMEKAQNEISHWPEYDYVVVNKDLPQTIHQVTHILEAERLRRHRQKSLAQAIQELCTH